ncbi:MAG: FAD-dependent thymidylate synthase [Candidatus Rhabdochlamydia sp.]
MIEDYEQFSQSKIKILNRYVTNTTSNIFVLKNLPEVIKGALFSRYSRSSLGLRALLLKDFILNEETAFATISAVANSEDDLIDSQQQQIAIKKAQNFYDRILDGYGDDSIGELGGAHLALENISMLAAKAIEDCRIGGSPLEKSTRYIYFDQKFKDEYLFFREPILMTSAYRELYVNTCNFLFDCYSRCITPLTAVMEKKFPKDQTVSQTAYAAAIRAKVLDCLRGLLPASTLTNMGVYGNGRFFEKWLQKSEASSLTEFQDIAKKSYQELATVIPSFIRRAEPSHPSYRNFQQFTQSMGQAISTISKHHMNSLKSVPKTGVTLVHYDPNSPAKVAAALLFPHGHQALYDLEAYCQNLPSEAVLEIFEAASNSRENRRHKSPRALEHATFTFEILADFGVYRDLQRHRMLTQDRQLLTCEFSYYLPEELKGTSMEADYIEAMEVAKKAYDTIVQEFPEEAQYVVPMAYNIHWYFHVNLRSLQWLCELRSAPAGHPGYRLIAQELAKQVSLACPLFELFFKFVDYEGYELGRLGQEVRTEQKRAIQLTLDPDAK